MGLSDNSPNETTQDALDDIKAKKSSVWVLSFNGGELTGADYLPSPLPVR